MHHIWKVRRAMTITNFSMRIASLAVPTHPVSQMFPGNGCTAPKIHMVHLLCQLTRAPPAALMFPGILLCGAQGVGWLHTLWAKVAIVCPKVAAMPCMQRMAPPCSSLVWPGAIQAAKCMRAWPTRPPLATWFFSKCGVHNSRIRVSQKGPRQPKLKNSK